MADATCEWKWYNVWVQDAWFIHTKYDHVEHVSLCHPISHEWLCFVLLTSARSICFQEHFRSFQSRSCWFPFTSLGTTSVESSLAAGGAWWSWNIWRCLGILLLEAFPRSSGIWRDWFGSSWVKISSLGISPKKLVDWSPWDAGTDLGLAFYIFLYPWFG